jgi:hypothetical protein
MSDDREATGIGFRKGAEEGQAGERILQLDGFEQLELDPVPSLLPMQGGFPGHEIPAARPLRSRKATPSPVQEKEDVTMSGEKRAERGREPLVVLPVQPSQLGDGRTRAAVIEQDGRKRSRTRRPPEQGAQL